MVIRGNNILTKILLILTLIVSAARSETQGQTFINEVASDSVSIVVDSAAFKSDTVSKAELTKKQGMFTAIGLGAAFMTGALVLLILKAGQNLEKALAGASM